MLNAKLKMALIGLLFLTVANCLEAAETNQWTQQRLSRLLEQTQEIKPSGEKVAFISEQFLNTRYKPNTLIGSELRPEQFQIRLDAVDCLTYLEYVEAMRRASSVAEFIEQLKQVRYQSGKIDYQWRKHFFSNWLDDPHRIQDVTRQVGLKASLKARKRLNDADSKALLPGVPAFEKIVEYIPAYKLDREILGRLKSGDYIGIYTDRNGLDVNHVGILIKKASSIYFRHADADAPNRKVVDADFMAFFKHQRGIVVFRPI